MKLKKDFYQGLNKTKAVLCLDPRCGLSFNLVDALQYHCHDSYLLNLVKFIPYRPMSSCVKVKDDYRPDNLFKGLDDKS